MRLGVIDVGSNTVHLLVVDAHWGGRPIPATSHKIELRLSEHTDENGHISKDGAQALERFVGECLVVAEDQGVEKLMGFVTSAIREADNGEAVLARVRERTGVDLTVLSGNDEARLTFLAARRWCGWSSGRITVVDIGGGSLEIATGMDEDPDGAVSMELGAGRVTRSLLPGNPPVGDEVRAARKAIRAELGRHLREITKFGDPDRAVGTSKTMRTLARLTGAAPRLDGLYVPRRLDKAALTALIPVIAPMSSAQRSAMPGVSEGRAHQVLAGALVAEGVMDLLGLDGLDICPWALREGVILNELDQMRMV